MLVLKPALTCTGLPVGDRPEDGARWGGVSCNLTSEHFSSYKWQRRVCAKMSNGLRILLGRSFENLRELADQIRASGDPQG